MSESRRLYQCPECGLHYTSLTAMRQCYAWCSEHKSCNLAITKLSVEAADSKKS